MEFHQRPPRARRVARVLARQSGGPGHRPVFTQGLDDRRLHQTLDIGPGRVVGAQLRTLGRRQGLFQQGAEDGGLDRFPLAPGGQQQDANLFTGQVEGLGVVIEAAVEAAHLLAGGAETRRETAGVHLAEQILGLQAETARRVLTAGQKPGEAVGGQQAYVLGEHGEQDAAEKGRHPLRGVAALLQRL